MVLIAVTLGALVPILSAEAAPPIGEADLSKGREGIRSFTTVLKPGDAEDKVLKRPFKVMPMHMTKGSAYLLNLTSASFDPVLRIVTEAGVEVARNDNADPGTKDARVDFIVPKDGEYHMIVSTANDQYGGFTLTVSPLGRPGDAGITLLEGKLKGGAPAEHILKTSKDRKYIVDLLFLAEVKAGKLSGENMKKSFVAENKAFSADPRRARLEFLSEGDDVLKLAISGSAEAPYLLRVRDIRAPGSIYDIGNEEVRIEDELTEEDSEDAKRRNRRCKIYRVKLRAGATFEINMTASYDTFLRLENPEGKEIASDDDGGDGLNARIRFPCKTAGVYSVIATTFNNDTGAFKLSIREWKKTP